MKCPFSIKNADFNKYAQEKSSCLEKVNDSFKLKRAQLLLSSSAAFGNLARENAL